jgi:hypothetical protein
MAPTSTHCHAIISDGAFSADGEFLPLPSLDPSAVVQVFRRMLLLRLHKAERLTESFMQNLLSWVHPGFSVYAGAPVQAAEMASLESQARYITRPAVAMDSLQRLDDGNLLMDTPSDPRTGATSITLDPLEWIHRLTLQIPDPGRHCQRFYGAYSNRARVPAPPADGQSPASPAANYSEKDNSDFSREARSTWARLIRKIFEADPLLCSCGARMRIVSFITEPRVIDRTPRPASLQALCNNSEPAADARLFNRTPVRRSCARMQPESQPASAQFRTRRDLTGVLKG